MVILLYMLILNIVNLELFYLRRLFMIVMGAKGEAFGPANEARTSTLEVLFTKRTSSSTKYY